MPPRSVFVVRAKSFIGSWWLGEDDGKLGWTTFDLAKHFVSATGAKNAMKKAPAVPLGTDKVFVEGVYTAQ